MTKRSTKRPCSKFRVGAIVRGPYQDDYRKVLARRWDVSAGAWVYKTDSRAGVEAIWYSESNLHRLTKRERELSA